MYKKIIITLLSIIFVSCSTEISTHEKLDLDFRELMREFVINISDYARYYNPDFIIIPQNGEGLITYDGEANGELATEYLSAIDGQGREDFIFGYTGDNEPTPDEERDYILNFLQREKEQGIEILITDYCRGKDNVDASYLLNSSLGFISFAADHRELNNIPGYPSEPYNVNSNSVQSLNDASNFLYLINPENFNSISEFINTLSSTNFDLLIIDLFFQDSILTEEAVEKLKFKANGGKRLVIAYMSIGEAEDYRYYWKNEWRNNPPSWLDAENPNWEGNYKVRYWEEEWQNIIMGSPDSYLDKIISANFDGVYLDIIDAYEYFEDNYQ